MRVLNQLNRVVIPCFLFALFFGFTQGCSSSSGTHTTNQGSNLVTFELLPSKTLPLVINGVPVRREEYHGLFGYLNLTNVPEENFPVTVSLFYKYIGHNVGYDQNFLENPGVTTTTIRREVRWEEKNDLIPVWNAESRAMYYSVDMEVRSQSNKLLSQQTLIDRANASQQTVGVSTLPSDAEAEVYLRNLGSVNIIKDDRIPSDPLAYRRTRSLWLGSSQLNDSKFSPSFYRQLMLAGTFLVGHTDVVQQLSQQLGLKPNSAVLDVGLLNGDDEIHMELLKTYTGNDLVGNSYGSMRHHEFDATPLTKNRLLSLRQYSLVFLALFVLLEGIIIALGFIFLKGHDCLKLWVLIPLSSFFYALIGWSIAPRLINLQPSSSVTEYQYAYHEWPEAYLDVSIKVLGFNKTQFNWEMPPGIKQVKAVAQAYYTPQSDLARGEPYEIDQFHDHTLFQLKAERGRLLTAEGEGWIKNGIPCKLIGLSKIEFAKSYDTVWLWDGSSWRDLRSVSQGETRDLREQSLLFQDNESPSPLWMQQRVNSTIPIFYQGIVSLPNRIRYLTDPRWTNSSYMKNEGILLGLSHQTDFVKPMWQPLGDFYPRHIDIYQFSLSPKTELKGLIKQ